MASSFSIAIASDHAAVDLKAALADHLRAGGHDVVDLSGAGPRRAFR